MKRIKMLLYGEPGVGKSVFASKAPKPFFITTDGNYEWLEDFGADPHAHAQVSSWAEAKEAFAQRYDDYETIVVDLLEDMFKWCEHDFCGRSKIDHLSDLGFGKGYDITRNEFFLEISKLLAKDKHIILITHGITFVTKDRRGVEHTKYAPSNRIPDKVLDMIEGRLRYCLRCYLKAEEQADGTILKKRFLSVVPKENEFGIIRGVDENTIPHDIPLEFSEFASVIGLYKQYEQEKKNEEIKDVIKDKISNIGKKKVEQQEVVQEVVQEVKEEVQEVQDVQEVQEVAQEVEEPKAQKIEEPQPQVQSQPINKQDKLAAIKAKLAAIKNQN